MENEGIYGLTPFMASPDALSQFLQSAMKNPGTLNTFGSIAGQTITASDLTFVPEYGLFRDLLVVFHWVG
jgi:hypothetical protein